LTARCARPYDDIEHFMTAQSQAIAIIMAAAIIIAGIA
jgi:hypothetical protein